jgi:hypothetical protein
VIFLKKNATIALALCGGLAIGLLAPVRAQNLGDVIKGGAIILAVDKFGRDIDKFVNKLIGDGGRDGAETKVVPILSVGKGTYAGAAQVTGPRALVEQVRAVAQVEGEGRVGVRFRAKGFIPISDRTVRTLESLKRVNGCGVTGFIDIKL